MTTDPKQPLDYMLQLDLRRLVEQQLGVELETIVRNRRFDRGERDRLTAQGWPRGASVDVRPYSVS